jgi:hypothetical protein
MNAGFEIIIVYTMPFHNKFFNIFDWCPPAEKSMIATRPW